MSVAVKNPENFSAFSTQSILEGLSDIILITQPSGAIEWSNELSQKVFSKKIKNLNELEGKKTNTSLLRAKKFKFEMIQNPGLYEDVVIDTVNHNYLYELKVHHFYDEVGKQKIALMFRDTTEKRKIEGELISKHQELRDVLLELKSTQDALVQSGKLAALGELSAGVAHELNQPLQIIRGFSQELNDYLGSEKNIIDHKVVSGFISEITGSVDKMSKIIQALRTFAAQSTEGFSVVEVKDVMSEVVLLTSKNLSHLGIKFEYELPTQKFNVYAHATQLQQVFMNFILNAKDALAEKNEADKKIKIQLTADRADVIVSIEDNGIGMTQEQLQKIFNPFFTTKEVGKGMGLGLSLSHSIIKKIHGSITVRSELGKGTQFLIKIPTDFRKQTDINEGEKS